MDQIFEKRKKIIYEFICDELYVPMKLKELAMLLQVPKSEREDLKAVMDSLEADGKVHVTQKGKYVKGKAEGVRGIYQAHPKGFGFVTVEDSEEDIFISGDDTNGAFHLDTVEVLVKKSQDGKRREGKITKIISHGMTTVVGYFQKNQNFGFVLPDNERIMQDIFITAERSEERRVGKECC